VLLKIAYLLMRWTFGLAVLMFRGDQAKNAEPLVLQHENAVLRRNAGRVRYEPADRAWFTALTRFIPRRRWTGVFPVTPTTLLAWHRRLAARRYDTSNRRQPGRPATVRSIAQLAVRLAKENPLWGYRRIHGELTRLGLTVAPPTVYEILRSSGIDPAPRRDGPTWRQFLHAQAAGILAVELLHVDTVLLNRPLWSGSACHRIAEHQLTADGGHVRKRRLALRHQPPSGLVSRMSARPGGARRLAGHHHALGLACALAGPGPWLCALLPASRLNQPVQPCA